MCSYWESLNYEALTGSDRKFNYFLSRARVSIENCFGALKVDFHLLINRVSAYTRRKIIDSYNRWIVTCFTLYNFCIENNSPAYITEIIGYFYHTHRRGKYFKTADIYPSEKRSSKFKKYNVYTNYVQ